jgi:hypothetical protein
MASSIYSEVTASLFDRDRVLDKLKTASTGLPYTVDDITISHNDFAVADVYNNSIGKLYKNYLYLIANAELLTKTPPTSSAPSFLSILSTFEGALSAVATDPSGAHGNVAPTAALSGLEETHITLKNDGTEKFLYFNYSPDQSVISETDVNLTTITTLVSGNEVEFDKTFKFKDVVSVDIVDNLLFILDRGSNTAFKFDITGLITDDKALKRTGINDTTNPGRYLLKTIGGEGISQTKNKLVRPNSLSVYKNKVYILDNGHNSLKVFDLDFNFIQEISAPNLFNNSNTGELVSIVVDQYSDTNESVYGYILSSKGKIIEYDVINNTLDQPQALFNFYDTRLYTLSGLNENDSFKKIVNSKAVKNILYICNNGKIYKYYKSNLNQYLGVLDLTLGNSGIKISGKENEQQILSFDTTLYNNKDYVAVTTRVNSPQSSNQRVSTYVYQDEHVTTKLYSENLYTNYFTLSDILVLPQEIVNNITFNKTTKKLIYNHYSLFENLNKKVYSFYDPSSGTAAVPTLCTVNYHEFTKPTSFDDNSNLYIGVNEPLLTDVINRPLKLLYSQQESLFDLIKEESLNSNPPDNIAIRLPANTESFPNVLALTCDTPTVSSGDSITMTVSRVNVLSTLPGCSFKYYTTLGTAASGDISYISSEDKSIGTFAKGEKEQEIYINTLPFFLSDTTEKTFNFIIEENTNCIIDPNSTTITGTITGQPHMYTISMSATSLSFNEGSTGRVAITRSVIGDATALPDEDLESSVNLVIDELSNAAGVYTPVVAGSTDKNVVDDRYSDFVFTGTNAYETSAAQIGSTSTIFFTQEVSSVYFDISAVNDLSEDSSTAHLGVKISNPSSGSVIGVSYEDVYINQDYRTVSLYLSAISAYDAEGSPGYTTDTTNMLSCVNVWAALSANETYQELSATNPFKVDFTIQSPLSVFSVSTVSAAIQFDPTTDNMVYSSNQFNCIVDDGAALVGKAGAGGSGALWLSGYDFDSTSNVTVSAHYYNSNTYVQDLSDAYDVGDNDNVYSAWRGWKAESGGPAIGFFDTYFSTISVFNDGLIYGGGGGGGGGMLGLSAEVDPALPYLSAGGGGGGGAGIHTANRGIGGLAGVETSGDQGDTLTQHTNYRHVFAKNGEAGSTNGFNTGTEGDPGAGGYWDGYTNSTNPTFPYISGGNPSPATAPKMPNGVDAVSITHYPTMSGLSGGNIGFPGASDSETVAIYPTHGTNVAGSFTADLTAAYNVRRGGDAGKIVEDGLYNTNYQVLTSSDGSGTYVGDASNISIS